jgi:hypothetical protein
MAVNDVSELSETYRSYIRENYNVPSLEDIEYTHSLFVKDYVRPTGFKVNTELKVNDKPNDGNESNNENTDQSCNHDFEVETLRCHKCMSLFRYSEMMKCRLCKFEKKQLVRTHECVSTCGFGQTVEFIIEQDGSYRTPPAVATITLPPVSNE